MCVRVRVHVRACALFQMQCISGSSHHCRQLRNRLTTISSFILISGSGGGGGNLDFFGVNDKAEVVTCVGESVRVTLH